MSYLQPTVQNKPPLVTFTGMRPIWSNTHAWYVLNPKGIPVVLVETRKEAERIVKALNKGYLIMSAL